MASILIVDDDRDIRDVLCNMLEFAGFETATAVDGEDALVKINEHRPSAVILDIMMPNMDGLTTCQMLREKAETADLPVILLSGKAHLTLLEQRLSTYANKYLEKPIGLTELIEHLADIGQIA